jgi:hypothetical protein
MDEPEITYRYFRLPINSQTSSPSRIVATSAASFAVSIAWLCMVVHGDAEAKKDIRHVCDERLSGGAFVERGLELNEGDIGALRDQTVRTPSRLLHR